jgi:hypothetical protein
LGLFDGAQEGRGFAEFLRFVALAGQQAIERFEHRDIVVEQANARRTIGCSIGCPRKCFRMMSLS